MNGLLDILLLGRLVTSAKQDDDRIASSHEIDAISRTVIDPKFTNTAEELRVAEVAKFHAVDANLNASLCASISQAREPPGENSGLADLDHIVNYSSQ